jgi:hypothetical protein
MTELITGRPTVLWTIPSTTLCAQFRKNMFHAYTRILHLVQIVHRLNIVCMKVINIIQNEICAVLGVYTASNGTSLPTFRKRLSVPSSRVKQSNRYFIPKRPYGSTACSCIKSRKRADLIYIAAKA